MNDWHKLHITDKSGKEFFKTTASPMSTFSEIKNLKRHIEQAKANPKHYKFLDVETAVIVLDGDVYSEREIIVDDLSYDELLQNLLG